jgi:hypothetical protein
LKTHRAAAERQEDRRNTFSIGGQLLGGFGIVYFFK